MDPDENHKVSAAFVIISGRQLTCHNTNIKKCPLISPDYFSLFTAHSPTMIPLRLSLSGFLSYRELIEIDFSDIDLACIAGPNGSGKSSLLDAITWALFGQARKRDDSLINTRCDTAEVTLVFGYEGNVYRVQRTKPRDRTTMLEFHILQDGDGGSGTGDQGSGTRDQGSGTGDQGVGNGEQLGVVRSDLSIEDGTWKPLTERTLRETEASIQQTLGLDYETFINASFFLQGKADQFTQQRPGDRKRILSNILGLEIWEAYRQRAAERRRKVESDIAVMDGQLQEIKLELDEEKIRKARLKELESELKRLARTRAAQESSLENVRKVAATLAEQEKLVNTLDRQMQASVRSVEEAQRRLAARLAEKESFGEVIDRAAEIESAHAAWEQARAELERWEEISRRAREQDKRLQEPLDEINAARARLSQERETLRKQREQVEADQAVVEGLQSQIASAQSSLKEAQEKLEQRARLQADLSEAHRHLAEAKAENPRLKAEMDELKTRIDQLSEAEGATCPVCGQPLSPEERQNLIRALTSQGKEMGDKYRANKALLDQSGQLVNDLERQIAELSKAEKEVPTNNQTLAQLSSRREVLEAQRQTWEKEGAPRLAEIGRALQDESFAPAARKRLAEIQAELDKIGYDPAAHEAARRRVAEGRTAESEMRALEKAQAAMAPLKREIKELQAQITRQKKEVARQQDEHAGAALALAEAQAQAPDLATAERDLFSLKEQENHLRLEVGAARQKVLVLEDLKSRRKALEADREIFAEQVGQYKQLERAFGKDGVPALLIEQALPQIESRANEILDRLSQGTMSVRFLTQAAYKDKRRDDLRETLDIQISDGAGIRDYEMFSGGEAFRVNFAIRLALSEVLAQRAGARLQTLVIDEGFGSQDAQGRQRLIEAINMIREDFAKVLVITHIDELKDAFPVRIEVEKTGRGSVVRVI
jgi:exonuclease SbcC